MDAYFIEVREYATAATIAALQMLEIRKYAYGG